MKLRKRYVVAALVLSVLFLTACTNDGNEVVTKFIFAIDSVNENTEATESAKAAFADQAEYNALTYRFMKIKNSDAVSEFEASQTVSAANYILMFGCTVSDHFIHTFTVIEDGPQAVIINEDGTYENVVTVSFNMNEPSFLAGVLAAKTSLNGRVGYIGYEEKTDEKYLNGFRAGVYSIDPLCEVITEYTLSYSNVDYGYKSAKYLYAQNVDVIFANCGACVLGVNKCAAEFGLKMICTDMYDLDDKSNCIAFVGKNYQNAVEAVIAACINSAYSNGSNYSYGFSSDFVSFEMTDAVSADTASLVDAWRQKIIWKQIIVPADEEEYNNIYEIDQTTDETAGTGEYVEDDNAN